MNRPRPMHLPEHELQDLERALRAATGAEVRCDRGYRALYATDGSNYRQVPLGVVLPRNAEDVVATMRVCHERGLPVLSRGGGTSLAGQTCNAAVVIDYSKHMNRILDIDPERRLARVEPGCVLDDLREQAGWHGLTYAPDPATHTHNCIGGMIGNNSCGPHSIMGGRTADNVQEMQVLTHDGLRLTVGPTSDEDFERIIAAGGRRGSIYGEMTAIRERYGEEVRRRYPDIPRRVSGYNLDDLLPERGCNLARALVGSEGTCVAVLEATLNLVPKPPAQALLVLAYADICDAGDHVPAVMAHRPQACEAIDDRLIAFLKRKGKETEGLGLLPEGGGWLLAEFGADSEAEAEAAARATMEALARDGGAPAMRVLTRADEQEAVWQVRESGLAATAWVPGMPPTWPGWEDSAVPPDKVGPYLRDFRRTLERYGYGCALYGHFGQGCIHVRIDFDLLTPDGIDTYKRFALDMADIVSRYGGSYSGEHGDGQARGWLLPRLYGDDLVAAMRRFKAAWDPDNLMNPGKVVDAYAPDDNLRLGPGFRPHDAGWSRQAAGVNFALKDDDGDIVRAAMRCVGVGKCRRRSGGVMCPSYMATGEEMHSTRGRARLLFEMIHGGPLHDGWNSREVHEALRLCLACKACKRDCPVDVDMATYKAEFHSHYYARHWRPRTHHSLGLVHWWARLASLAPGVANALGQTRPFADLGKRLAGIAPQRRLPRFARRTFKQEARDRGRCNAGGAPVAFFTDTFANHLHTGVARAAVQVLEAAGCDVTVPANAFCCGRPLYDIGRLDLARRNLQGVMETFGPLARRGVPIVGVEPACVTALKDELIGLFPEDERAQAIAANAWMLADFLAARTDWRPPPLARKAVVQPHCHQHAVLGFEGNRTMMAHMGMRPEVVDGCCGMAGAFGFEAGEPYDVSLACAERRLLPAVRAADGDTLVLADGYACREQVMQASPRRPLHLAQAMRLALEKR